MAVIYVSLSVTGFTKQFIAGDLEFPRTAMSFDSTAGAVFFYTIKGAGKFRIAGSLISSQAFVSTDILDFYSERRNSN